MRVIKLEEREICLTEEQYERLLCRFSPETFKKAKKGEITGKIVVDAPCLCADFSSCDSCPCQSKVCNDERCSYIMKELGLYPYHLSLSRSEYIVRLDEKDEAEKEVSRIYNYLTTLEKKTR